MDKLTGRWTDVTFGYKTDGLFTSQAEIDNLTFKYNEANGNSAVKPGDIRYVDINNDHLLDWRDQVEIGKGTTPHWMMGLNIGLNYKKFDLSALLQGALGYYSSITLCYVNGYSELMYRERWTEDNNRRDCLVPRLGGTYNDYPSDFYYKKADYLRLKTFSLGYKLPHFILQKVGIEDMRVSVSGTNLFTISGLNKYDVDPEAPSGKSGYYYPQMRTISLGLDLSF